MKGGRDLAKPVRECERQHVQDHIIRRELQITADRGGGGRQVAVGQHHALRLSGGARGVHKGSEIGVCAIHRPRLPQRPPAVAGNQHGRSAIGQNPAKPLDRRVRRDDGEHASGFEHAEQRHDGFDGVLEADHDTVARFETCVLQRVSEDVRLRLDLSKRVPFLAADDSRLVAVELRPPLEDLINSHGQPSSGRRAVCVR